MNDKKKHLKHIFEKHGKTYIPINNETSLNKIYELFVNNNLYEADLDIEIFYLGRYYEIIIIDDTLMVKYYIMSSNNNNYYSMIILSNYYYKINKVKLSRQYLLMTCEKYINYFASLYKNSMNDLEYIELLMNNGDNNSKRNYMTLCINNYDFKTHKSDKFLQLIKNFDFNSDDKLSFEVNNMIKN